MPPSAPVSGSLMLGYISDRAYVKRSVVTPALAKRIRTELSYTNYTRDIVRSSQQYRNSGFGSSEMQVVKIENYWRVGDYVSLPRKWALDNIPGDYADNTKFPVIPAMRHFKRIAPRDSKQHTFFMSLLAQASKLGPQHILANATTGAGKTVSQIWLGQQLATRTLLIVDSNKIANGYLKNFVKFFGQEWTDRNVGRIQQDQCDIDKPFSIGMVQSLASRHYASKVYQSFGLVCYDEVQIYGNLAYHRVLGMFSARVLAGFTATNKGGSFGKVITGYIGNPAALSTQKVMRPDVHVVTYKLPRLISVFSDGALINDLVRIKDRNDLITRLLLDRGWGRKRVCLVLSDRIEQLQGLMKSLITSGVPESAIGLHVGEYEDGTWTVAYSYDDGNRWIKFKMSLTQHLADELTRELTEAKITSKVWDRAYIPPAVKKFVQKNRKHGIQFFPMRNTVKPSEQTLDSIANSCYIILATYRIFGKGVDYPRIDMGLEASPIGNVTQPLGRITRLLEGKPTPEWWSIYDRFIPDNQTTVNQAEVINAFFDSKQESRKRGFRSAGTNAIYHKAEDYRG